MPLPTMFFNKCLSYLVILYKYDRNENLADFIFHEIITFFRDRGRIGRVWGQFPTAGGHPTLR